jgi:hypothetical protein
MLNGNIYKLRILRYIMEKEKNMHHVGIRGNRELWLKFTYKIRQENKQVWDVLSILLKKYISGEINDKN